MGGAEDVDLGPSGARGVVENDSNARSHPCGYRPLSKGPPARLGQRATLWAREEPPHPPHRMGAEARLEAAVAALAPVQGRCAPRIPRTTPHHNRTLPHPSHPPPSTALLSLQVPRHRGSKTPRRRRRPRRWTLPRRRTLRWWATAPNPYPRPDPNPDPNTDPNTDPKFHQLGDKSFFREGQTLGRGMPVEVLMQEDGLRGSKYGGLVLEVRQLAALVQYDELLEEGTDEDGRQIKLTEYVAHGGIFPVPAPPLPEWLEAVELETPLEVLHEDGWSAFAPPPPPPSPPPHLPLTSPSSPSAASAALPSTSVASAAVSSAPVASASPTAASFAPGGRSSSSGTRRPRTCAPTASLWTSAARSRARWGARWGSGGWKSRGCGRSPPAPSTRRRRHRRTTGSGLTRATESRSRCDGPLARPSLSTTAPELAWRP